MTVKQTQKCGTPENNWWKNIQFFVAKDKQKETEGFWERLN